MTAVGFEAAQFTLVELEPGPLDHPGKLSLGWKDFSFKIAGFGFKMAGISFKMAGFSFKMVDFSFKSASRCKAFPAPGFPSARLAHARLAHARLSPLRFRVFTFLIERCCEHQGLYERGCTPPIGAKPCSCTCRARP